MHALSRSHVVYLHIASSRYSCRTLSVALEKSAGNPRHVLKVSGKKKDRYSYTQKGKRKFSHRVRKAFKAVRVERRREKNFQA